MSLLRFKVAEGFKQDPGPATCYACLGSSFVRSKDYKMAGTHTVLPGQIFFHGRRRSLALIDDEPASEAFVFCAVSARSTQQLSAHHREVAGLGQNDGTR